MADDTFDWNIDGSGYGQASPASCWWAGYAIIHSWKARPLNAIRQGIEKAGLDYSDYYKNGLPQEDFPKTRAALGLVGWRGEYAFSISEDFQALALMLKGYGPLWCAFAKPGAHIVVITGVDARLRQIHILNPWNNTNGNDADSQFLTPAVFRSRLNASAYSVLQGFM